MRRVRRRRSKATVRSISCSKTVYRRCGRWPGSWCAKASPASPSALTAGVRLGYTWELPDANVAELVDAPDLGSGGETRASSSLAFRTTAPAAAQMRATPTRIDMQVSVESISKLERRMQVQVPAERVSQEIAARLKNLSRTARLKGFRPGKAPIKVIRQQFGVQVHREVIGELLADHLDRRLARAKALE